jgi:magnesium transporter
MPDKIDIKSRVIDLVTSDQWSEVAGAMRDQHPADLAEVVKSVPSEHRGQVFDLIARDLRAEVLASLEGDAEDEVLESLTNAELSDLVEHMSPDDAADILGELPADRSEEVLGLMEREESDEVRELLQYDEESAGGIMTTDFLALRNTLTVTEALDQIAASELDEPMYNAYVVDRRGVLLGVIGLWELLRTRDRTVTLQSISHGELMSTTTDTDQEEVAHTMAKYDLTALPVVDLSNRLVGRITVDDVVDVIEEEASEDIFRLAGSDDSELDYTSPLRAGKARLPWLLVTLGITFFGSLILKRFMLDLTEVLALSFFVPIVMAMCGSTGMQSSTLIIRSLALHNLEGVAPLKLLGREVITGLLLGVICGIIMAGWALFVVTHSPEHHSHYPPLFLAITAGSALVSAMTFAAVYGAFVPMLLNRLRVDPAVASGPFVTASNDIIALLIYYATTLGLIAFQGWHGGVHP